MLVKAVHGAALVLVAALAFPRVARADIDYYDREDDNGMLTFHVDNPRTTSEWVVIASLAGATLVSAGTGLLVQRSGDHEADQVEAKDRTGLVWDQERQNTYDSAISRRRAGYILYGVSGGFLIATITAFLVTDHGSRAIRVGTSQEGIGSSLQLVPGGALVTRGWRF